MQECPPAFDPHLKSISLVCFHRVCDHHSQPHAKGDALHPTPGVAGSLCPPCPPSPACAPRTPCHRQLQRSPFRRRCRRRDRWCPGRHTCLGFILAPNLHYFTRQPAPYRCHPHAANWGGKEIKYPQCTQARCRSSPSSAIPQGSSPG